MKPEKSPAPGGSNEKIFPLTEPFLETAQRLETTAGVEVGTQVILNRRALILRRAHDRRRQEETATQVAILNALPAQIALLDTRGLIISVNEAWRRFTSANAMERQGYGIGINYLEICDKARGDGSSEAHQIAEGIRSVLGGGKKYFAMEYPSHSLTEQRWFLLTVVPLSSDSPNGAVVTHLDITEQRKSKDDLRESERRFSDMLANVELVSLMLDRGGRITYCNDYLLRLTGWRRPEIMGRDWFELFIPFGRDDVKQVFFALLADLPSAWHHENEILTRSGARRLIQWNNTALRSAAGEVIGTASIGDDITERKEAEKHRVQMEAEMAHSAQHDFLTGLPNRVLLNDRIGQAIASAPRHDKQVAVLFLDLDGFKNINGSLGHTIGDKLLQSVAKRLGQCVRTSDTVSRQGGDEFVVLLSEAEQWEDAAIIAGRILQSVAEPHAIDEHDLHVTASIGVSIYPDDGRDAETLIKSADTAMYHAKEQGHQSYQFFKPDMNTRAVERQSIEANLRRALERREFRLTYQPKINLRTGAITGAEALIRWMHPTRGLIAPTKFIPIAEECGLILTIGNWVLREACKQAREWVDSGLPVTGMAVNISAIQLRQKAFLQDVFEILRETGLEPRSLELELTESVLMKRTESTASILQSLRKTGVQIAVDDFGTGYSSLSYLGKLPIDALKIDQSFVRQISPAGDDSAIVTAVISMARNLKLRVIAEGVETQQEAAFLRAHQCDEAQGYYFSLPLPPDQFAMLLKSGCRDFAFDDASANSPKVRDT